MRRDVLLQALFWLVLQAPAAASVSSEQAATLHARLTPLGAERAGNAAGTIPPWTGGLTNRSGSRTPLWSDPFADDHPLFTITADTASRYAAELPEGALALFHRFPDYRMRIFATRRTAAFPQAVYDAVARNATRAGPAATGIATGVQGAAGGIPFPIPANGAEAVWNHLLAFWGAAREGHVSTFVASGDGSIEQSAGYQEITDFPFYAPGATPESVGRYYFKTRRLQDAPASRAGSAYIAWQPLDVATTPFAAWRYLPGEHRTRRAPSLSYDTPDPDADGYETLDDYYVFFGGQDRYVFRLLGKREMFVPYNNNWLALHDAREAMGPRHADQDRLRYELHRVWIVEGTLAPGQHHVAPKRRLYLDEDTWLALYSEAWDDDGHLWKFGHATVFALPTVPAVIGGSQFFYDLVQGGYCYDFVVQPRDAYRLTPMHAADTFTPGGMASEALR